MSTGGSESSMLVEPMVDRPVAPQLALPAGLTAAADEISAGRSSQALQRLAVEVQRGRPLADAAVDPRVGLPAELSELLLAGAQSGQLLEIAERYSAMIRRRQAFRRELWLLLLYPALLFALLFVVGMANWLLFRPFYLAFFNEFELEVAPWIEGMSWLLGPGLASLTGLAAAAMLLMAITWPIGGKRVAHVLRQGIPLLGPVYRYRAISEFAELLGLLVRSGLPLPVALRHTAQGMSDTSCAAASNRLAQHVEQGMGLGQALDAEYSLLSPLCPLVAYGERQGVLAEALDALAEMYSSRTEAQGNILRIVLPPVLVLIVAAAAGMMFLVVMLPLFQFISALT